MNDVANANSSGYKIVGVWKETGSGAKARRTFGKK